jgi:hypothetical protein
MGLYGFGIVLAPAMATKVIDRAIEVFGAAGVSDDTPLAYFYAWARVLRIVDGLRAEGEPVTLAVWQLGEDLHALASVHEAAARGVSIANAVRGARVWGKRQPALERAARRVHADAVAPLVAALAKLDALAKGLGRGDPWDDVVDIGLALCGRRVAATA